MTNFLGGIVGATRPKSLLSTFYVQRGRSQRSLYFTARLAQKTAADIDLLLIVTRTADEPLKGINIDDLKRSWTRKVKGFSDFFAIFGCGPHFKSELRTGDRSRQLANKNCYKLSRVLWALRFLVNTAWDHFTKLLTLMHSKKKMNAANFGVKRSQSTRL